MPSFESGINPANTLLGSGSPKNIYLYFILACLKDFYSSIKESDTVALNNAILTLITFVPDDDIRRDILKTYEKERADREEKDGNSYVAVSGAAVMALGMIVSYLNKSLELTEHKVATTL